jgi:hypothetical protein
MTKDVRLKDGTISDVCIGRQGRYATWVTRPHDDTDEVIVVRASFRQDGTSRILPLLQSQETIPFELKRLTSLSLDESTGRICVGLFTGEIYILEL